MHNNNSSKDTLLSKNMTFGDDRRIPDAYAENFMMEETDQVRKMTTLQAVKHRSNSKEKETFDYKQYKEKMHNVEPTGFNPKKNLKKAIINNIKTRRLQDQLEDMI